MKIGRVWPRNDLSLKEQSIEDIEKHNSHKTLVLALRGLKCICTCIYIERFMDYFLYCIQMYILLILFGCRLCKISQKILSIHS